jgi:hypothetical protein
MCGRVPGVQLQPELILEQERAVEPLVRAGDLGEPGELLGGLALGCFEQGPAGVLDPAVARRLARVVLVPLGTADVVDRTAGELADVKEGSNTISGVNCGPCSASAAIAFS